MNKTKRARPVSFNSKNKEDVEMTEFLKGRPFSTYVKELIKAEMERQSFGSAANTLKSNTATPQQPRRVLPVKGVTSLGSKKATTNPPPYNPMLRRD